MWQIYDWSKHDNEHYDPAKGERSYGNIMITSLSNEREVRYVLIVQNPEKMWGFPKGHREDGETPIAAATREVKEETGVELEVGARYKGEVCMSYRITTTEEKLDLHIARQIERGEKPHWNQPGTFSKQLICFVYEVDEKPTPIVNDEGIIDARWVSITDATKMIIESYSNQYELLYNAMKLM